MTQHTDCRHCTVPADDGDVCTFCSTYRPPADTATTWHDLRDQLTDIQIAWITGFEKRYPDLDGSISADINEITLHYARTHAEQNKIDQEQFGHLPIPEGARHVMHWENDGTGRWYRGFDGQEWIVKIPGPEGSTRARVDISGTQREDGSIERHIYVSADDCWYTAEQAIQLAGALVSAAAELNRMGGDDTEAQNG